MFKQLLFSILLVGSVVFLPGCAKTPQGRLVGEWQTDDGVMSLSFKDDGNGVSTTKIGGIPAKLLILGFPKMEPDVKAHYRMVDDDTILAITDTTWVMSGEEIRVVMYPPPGSQNKTLGELNLKFDDKAHLSFVGSDPKVTLHKIEATDRLPRNP